MLPIETGLDIITLVCCTFMETVVAACDEQERGLRGALLTFCHIVSVFLEILRCDSNLHLHDEESEYPV